MRRPENDPLLTEKLSKVHLDYPMIDHYVQAGQLNALWDHIEKMKAKMEEVQFRINDIRFPELGSVKFRP